MKRNSAKHFVDSHGDDPAQQNAAICWRMRRGRVQVLLITSRDTGRWILPKGWPMDGKTAAETAACEAWEEAGVEGAIDDSGPLGFYGYEKIRMPKQSLPCLVSVFALRVTGLASKFPERKQRRRKWFDAPKAAQKVAETELRHLLDHLVVSNDQLAVAEGKLPDA
jgi:8-oxo-dGTP pyrophosphatase MutT (NUDIX family)